jgi:hypothetical protein
VPSLNVAALLGGEPGPLELWTLRAIASAGCALSVVQAARAAEPPWRRASELLERHGPLGAVSRALGAAVGARVADQERELLDELFDGDDLRAWWSGIDPAPLPVPALNHARARAALAALAPDVIVRVSGGLLEPGVFSQARIAALNIHHGLAPLIRGMWSIPWGIVEGRRDWIGATIHVIDAGIDTGPVLWRGGPQLAPGDTNVDLLFRAHLEAAKALADILRVYASGERPQPLPAVPAGAYRSAAGLWDWIRFLRLDRGRMAPVLLERALE